MQRRDLASEGWIVGGTLVSLAALAFSLLKGRRLPGRIASGFAGAFLEKWGDLRLERRVAALLGQAGAEGRLPEAGAGIPPPWGRP